MSDDEWDRLRELEASLGPQRRLARLARRLDSASVYTGFRRITVLWAAGGILGLTLVVVGTAEHSATLLMVAVAALIATVLTVGVALIVVQLGEIRADQRRPRPPS